MRASRRALALAALSGALALLTLSAAGRAQDDRVAIFLWHAYGESEARGLEAAVDAFEAEHAARELVDIALARYRDGLSTYDPVIDANHTLLEISRRQIQIQRALCDGTIQLIVALGGTW